MWFPVIVSFLFYAAVVFGYLYMLMIIWSICFPGRRIWPPAAKTWKFYLSWGVFYLGVGPTVALIFLDWNTWRIPSAIRFGVGAPLTLLGLGVVVWGIRTLGLVGTHGLESRFTARGPYQFTRNPQYLGDIIMLMGLILMANSVLVTVVNLIIILSFILMPLSEESWLTEQYGEDYLRYKAQTSRFL